MLPHNLSLLDSFRHVLPRVLMLDGGRYVVGTLVMMSVLWLVHRTTWRARIIQDRRPTRADYAREIRTSVGAIAVYALVTTPVLWLRSHGYGADRFMDASPLVIAAFVALLLVAHDAYFYWTHRLLHDPRLFKRMHRLHHRSITPTPFAAYAFSVYEAVVQVGFVALWVLLIPTPQWSLFIFLGIMIVRNVTGHAGTELHPRGMADHPVFGWITTTTHHDLHHGGGFNYNYGLYFTWWDRMMGTEHPRYREIYREITGRTAKAAPAAIPAELAAE